MSTLSLEFSMHFNLTLHYSIKTKKPPLYIYTPSFLSLSLSLTKVKSLLAISPSSLFLSLNLSVTQTPIPEQHEVENGWSFRVLSHHRVGHP